MRESIAEPYDARPIDIRESVLRFSRDVICSFTEYLELPFSCEASHFVSFKLGIQDRAGKLDDVAARSNHVE